MNIMMYNPCLQTCIKEGGLDIVIDPDDIHRVKNFVMFSYRHAVQIYLSLHIFLQMHYT